MIQRNVLQIIMFSIWQSFPPKDWLLCRFFKKKNIHCFTTLKGWGQKFDLCCQIWTFENSFFEIQTRVELGKGEEEEEALEQVNRIFIINVCQLPEGDSRQFCCCVPQSRYSAHRIFHIYQNICITKTCPWNSPIPTHIFHKNILTHSKLQDQILQARLHSTVC